MSPATRWRFDDPALLYLYPATYVAHLAEELLSTAPMVLWSVRVDLPIPTLAFVSANGLGLLLMVIGIRLVRRGRTFHWIVPALGCAVLLNTSGHVAGSFFARAYSAGLATSIILWVPLGLLTLIRACEQTDRRTIAAGVLAGITIELVVTIAASVMQSPR